ncbi:MAG: insulinase family protein [Rhodomicrobium sp.]|nr:insulinase family protein [Rhodomicrobium sp.]
MDSRALPYFVAASGDVDPHHALAALADAFRTTDPVEGIPVSKPAAPVLDSTERIAEPRAQAALGYIVRAPGGAAPDALAWRIALYVLAHDYGGRLGAEAISRQGLLYYVGADYTADAETGWVTLSMGVDPERLAPLRDLLKAELRRLVEAPPTAAEIDEAKRHLIGRRISADAKQRGDRLGACGRMDALGGLRAPAELAEALSKVTREDVLSILPDFAAGGIITVDVGAGPAQ